MSYKMKIAPETEAQPLEMVSPTKAPVKPKQNKLWLTFLVTCFFGVQFALVGLAFYSFIYAVAQSNRVAEEKVNGEFQAVEIHYTTNNTKKLGYFIANLKGSLSRVNGTYDITENNLFYSPLKLCYLYSDPGLVIDTITGLKDPTAMNSVKLVLAMLIFLDLFDSFKGVLPKLWFWVKKKFAGTGETLRKICCIPKKKEGESDYYSTSLTGKHKYCYQIMCLLIIASPRYLSLHFNGEDYSNCVGFSENDPFFQIFHSTFYPTPNANTIQTWDTDSSDVGFRIYQVYVAIFFANVGSLVCVPWLPNEPWNSKCIKVCLLVSMLLQLFGIGYYVFNYWLLASQIQNDIQIILSLLYIGRDGLNIIIMAIFDTGMKKLQDLLDSLNDVGALKAKSAVIDKVNDIYDNPKDVLQYVGDKLDGKMDEAQKKEEEEDEQNKRQNNQLNSNPVEEFNKLL